MSAAENIATLIGGAMSPPAIVLLLIILATLILEDAATVGVGMLAAHGSVPVELALAGLVLGTIIGDFGLHLIGRWAGDNRRVRRLRENKRVAQMEEWLQRRPISALALARFVPGLRLPTFLASGLIRFPMGRTFAVLALGTLIWTPALFWLSHSVMIAAETIGAIGWALAGLLIVAALVAPRIASRRFAAVGAA